LDERLALGVPAVQYKRKRIWIDRFQTTLSIRLAVYFLLYQVALWALFFINGRLTVLAESMGWSGPSCGVILTPVVAIGLALLFIFDAVRETHRVVGPLYRFRKTIQAVTSGEEVGLIKLREGDYLQDLKEDLNAMLRALEQRRAIHLNESGKAMEELTSVGA
jgi:hypothetical protein